MQRNSKRNPFVQSSSFVKLANGDLKRRKAKLLYKDIYLEQKNYVDSIAEYLKEDQYNQIFNNKKEKNNNYKHLSEIPININEHHSIPTKPHKKPLGKVRQIMVMNDNNTQNKKSVNDNNNNIRTFSTLDFISNDNEIQSNNSKCPFSASVTTKHTSKLFHGRNLKLNHTNTNSINSPYRNDHQHLFTSEGNSSHFKSESIEQLRRIRNEIDFLIEIELAKIRDGKTSGSLTLSKSNPFIGEMDKTNSSIPSLHSINTFKHDTMKGNKKKIFNEKGTLSQDRRAFFIENNEYLEEDISGSENGIRRKNIDNEGNANVKRKYVSSEGDNYMRDSDEFSGKQENNLNIVTEKDEEMYNHNLEKEKRIMNKNSRTNRNTVSKYNNNNIDDELDIHGSDVNNKENNSIQNKHHNNFGGKNQNLQILKIENNNYANKNDNNIDFEKNYLNDDGNQQHSGERNNDKINENALDNKNNDDYESFSIKNKNKNILSEKEKLHTNNNKNVSSNNKISKNLSDEKRQNSSEIINDDVQGKRYNIPNKDNNSEIKFIYSSNKYKENNLNLQFPNSQNKLSNDEQSNIENMENNHIHNTNNLNDNNNDKHESEISKSKKHSSNSMPKDLILNTQNEQQFHNQTNSFNNQLFSKIEINSTPEEHIILAHDSNNIVQDEVNKQFNYNNNHSGSIIENNKQEKTIIFSCKDENNLINNNETHDKDNIQSNNYSLSKDNECINNNAIIPLKTNTDNQNSITNIKINENENPSNHSSVSHNSNVNHLQNDSQKSSNNQNGLTNQDNNLNVKDSGNFSNERDIILYQQNEIGSNYNKEHSQNEQIKNISTQKLHDNNKASVNDFITNNNIINQNQQKNKTNNIQQPNQKNITSIINDPLNPHIHNTEHINEHQISEKQFLPNDKPSLLNNDNTNQKEILSSTEQQINNKHLNTDNILLPKDNQPESNNEAANMNKALKSVPYYKNPLPKETPTNLYKKEFFEELENKTNSEQNIPSSPLNPQNNELPIQDKKFFSLESIETIHLDTHSPDKNIFSKESTFDEVFQSQRHLKKQTFQKLAQNVFSSRQALHEEQPIPKQIEFSSIDVNEHNRINQLLKAKALKELSNLQEEEKLALLKLHPQKEHNQYKSKYNPLPEDIDINQDINFESPTDLFIRKMKGKTNYFDTKNKSSFMKFKKEEEDSFYKLSPKYKN